jgi:hypothetical protein
MHSPQSEVQTSSHTREMDAALAENGKALKREAVSRGRPPWHIKLRLIRSRAGILRLVLWSVADGDLEAF